MSNIGPGERNLTTLLTTLTTTLHPQIYVFITLLETASNLPSAIPPTLHPQMIFKETESTTLIATRSDAEDHNLAYSFPCRMITLNVQSSLSAVGFLAVITEGLRKREIPVNPVSAFHHDHLFVPEGREVEAMEVLENIAREAKGE